jgi:large subunit ribosomal protein L31
MKKDLHPKNYRTVVFQDLNDNTTYLTKSTVATQDTIELSGVTYPLVKVHISSSSHPFYTGQEKLMDVEGRVDRFKARRKAAEKAQEARNKANAKKSTSKKDKAPKTTEPTNKKQKVADK